MARSDWSHLRGSLISLFIITGVVLFVLMGLGFSIGHEYNNERGEEALRYKEIVFLSAAGKSINQTDIRKIDISKDLSWAPRVGSYIRAQHDKGVLLGEILKQYREIFDKSQTFSTDGDRRKSFLILLGRRGVRAEILSMADDWRWQEMADNTEDMKTLNLIISGQSGPSSLAHEPLAFPWKTFLLWWLIVTQFLSYLFCVISMDDKDISISDELRWNRFRAYVVLLFFSPGALPLLFINPGLIGFLKWIGRRSDEKRNQKRETRSRLDRLVPERHSSSGQELLDKLKRRVGEV